MINIAKRPLLTLAAEAASLNHYCNSNYNVASNTNPPSARKAIAPACEQDKVSCSILSKVAHGNSNHNNSGEPQQQLEDSHIWTKSISHRLGSVRIFDECDKSYQNSLNRKKKLPLSQNCQSLLTNRRSNCLPLFTRSLFTTTNHHHHHQQESPTKMAQIISGKEVSDEIRAKLKQKVESMAIKPKLAIVQVGGREDSNVYIRMKIQFAESIGASAELIKFGRDVSEQELAKRIGELNKDKNVHGIITQLPFDCSTKINSDYIVNLIDPSKDVDGLSVYNAGKLSHGELDKSSFVPCTPNGCMELIRKSGVKIEGSHSVVIGRSKIVGSPMAQLLLWHNSTVTICHSRTKNIEDICRQADILVAAVGQAQMVKRSWLKPGAVVIDCGINVIPDATKKSGTRLVGDVDFDDCKEVASAITPVPGGVGPMTVAMLISNTVESASRVADPS